MSTSTTQTPPERRIQPDRAFERYIWTDPTTCNNCFRRCKRVHTLERDDWGNTVQEHDRTSNGTLGYHIEDKDEYGALDQHLPRTTCAECGSVRLLAQHDTLSKQEAVKRCGELIERLREAEIAVSKQAVYHTVRALKSREELEAYDREIFERATKLGIEFAGRLP